MLWIGNRRYGGLLSALVASYCGVILVTFTRGTMGSVLLPQAVFILLSPIVMFKPVLPALRPIGVTRWTYGVFFVYLLAIGVGFLRYDPATSFAMAGQYSSIAGIPLSVLMTSYRLFVLVTLVLAFTIPLHYTVDRQVMERCLRVCWLMTGLLSVATILDYLGFANLKFDITVSLNDADIENLHRVIMGFRRGSLGLMLFLGIFISYALALISYRPSTKFFVWLSMPILVTALLFTWSRAAILAMLVSLFCLVFMVGGRGLLRGVFLFFLGIVTFSMAVQVNRSLNERLTSVFVMGADDSVYGRLDGWRDITRYLWSAPDVLVSGVGFQNFQYALTVGERQVGLIAAHNSYLHILTETGLFGLLIFLLWVLSIFSWLFAWRLQEPDNVKKMVPGIFMSVMIGVLVSALTQESLAPTSSMIPWLLHFYLVLGLLVSWYRCETWKRSYLTTQIHLVKDIPRRRLYTA